jgi:hypothetical protein
LARAVVAVEAQLLVLAVVVVEAQLLVLAVAAVEAQLLVLAVVAVEARLVVALTEALSLGLFSHRSFSAGMARISPTTQQPTYERVPRSR